MKLLLTWFRDAARIPPETLRLADIDRARVLRLLEAHQSRAAARATVRASRPVGILALCSGCSARPAATFRGVMPLNGSVLRCPPWAWKARR